jgi:hypothetical protein
MSGDASSALDRQVPAGPAVSRRRACLIAAIVLATTAPLIGFVWGSWIEQRRRGELRRALELLDRGAYAEAWPALHDAAHREPGRADAVMALGLCAEGLDRPGDALAAWARIGRDSPLYRRAVALRLRAARRSGRFAAADGIKADDLPREGEPAEEARDDLVYLLRIQGRSDEARAVLQQTWARARDPVVILRTLWSLDADPFPIYSVRGVLDEAARKAPDDLRVRCAHAHLALCEGKLDEADRVLDDCARRAPGDAVVARLRLDLARTRRDAGAVRKFAAVLSEDALPTPELLALRAMLARWEDDLVAERQAWRLLLQLSPQDATALERSAELAACAGGIAEAAQLRERKAWRDEAQRRYEGGLEAEADPRARARELAGLAESLGRRFEASAWWTLVARDAPGDSEARAALLRLDRPSPPPGIDRAALLADLRAVGRDPAPTASAPDLAPDGPVIPTFADEAASSGLDFAFANGASPAKQLPETMSGGVAFLDYDGDGWLDVYVVQGGPFPPTPGARNADRLFRNNGDGTFADATERAGLAAFAGGYGHGVAVGDLDNDGDPDVLVTRWRGYALYVNAGDGTFADATVAWGLGGDRGWPSSAAFADLDGDGDLDLYVCHYAQWDEHDPRMCQTPKGDPTYCAPAAIPAQSDRLYRNDGGRFIDVSEEAGITRADTEGRGLGVVAADLDGDGLVDLFVANDTTANLFFRNLGGWTFQERAHPFGLAANAQGGYLAGMGVACGDLDGDGRIDLAVTNFYGESTTYYRNLGGGQFADHTAAVGLTAPTRYRLGFGIVFADMNNDSHLDIVQANGHVEDFSMAYPYAMPAQLLLGTPTGRLADVSGRAGAAWSVPRFGRGLAVGDVDNDGRLDALLVDQRGPLALLRNQGPSGGHFVTLRLVGTRSNRDAVGAVVSLEAGGRRQVAQRFGGGSYQSACDGRLHFGLGAATVLDRLEVRWPSGAVQHWTGLAADRGYRLVEGEPDAAPLPGFGPRREAP